MPGCKECANYNKFLCKECEADRYPERTKENQKEGFESCSPCNKPGRFVRTVDGRVECGTCKKYIPNCETCDNESKCNRCLKGFFKLATGNKDGCTRCTSGEYFIENSKLTDGSGIFSIIPRIIFYYINR